MAEREVELSGHDAGRLHLRLLGPACDGCQGGCAGRCNLFATDDAGDFTMAEPEGFDARVGDRLRLQLDDAGLRRAAWQGYGLAWLGLLLGAATGRVLGLAWPVHADLLTLAGLVAGTFSAVRFSKRHLPEPRLLPATGPDPLQPCTSDRP